jgi:hypothetical protein
MKIKLYSLADILDQHPDPVKVSRKDCDGLLEYPVWLVGAMTGRVAVLRRPGEKELCQVASDMCQWVIYQQGMQTCFADKRF